MLDFMTTGACRAASVLLTLIAFPLAAGAQQNPFHITPSEKAACTDDAERLCSSSWPDEGRLMSCMKANKASLGANCNRVFTAGMKRRGLSPDAGSDVVQREPTR